MRGLGQERMIHSLTLAFLLTVLSCLCCADSAKEPRTFLTQHIGLTSQQLLSIERGEVVTKSISSRMPEEVLVVGAVFVQARPEDYPPLAFDIERLLQSPSYVAVGRIRVPPQLSDLDGFVLEPEDVKSLRSCRSGSCGVQMTDEMMQAVRRNIDWDAPTAVGNASLQMKKMAMELVARYQTGGNRALGIYRDKGYPFDVDAELRSLLDQLPMLPKYLPSLRTYLLEYPRATLPQEDSFFFWERVSFGLKPTLRLNHATAYRENGPGGKAEVVIVKQIYASHYLQLALDLTACVPGHSKAGEPGFYLITFKGSRQHGLTGFIGGIARRIIVSRTRTAQEKILLNIKANLESKRNVQATVR